MSSDGKKFFRDWVASNLGTEQQSTTSRETPSSMLNALRNSASEANISETELRKAVGDLYQAVAQAMLDAPVNDARPVQAVDPSPGPGSQAVRAMQLAISYLDGLREAIGDDIALAADLVLCNLGQQGFLLSPHDRPTLSFRSTLLHYHGEATASHAVRQPDAGRGGVRSTLAEEPEQIGLSGS